MGKRHNSCGLTYKTENQGEVEAVPGRLGRDSLLVGLCSRALATRRGLRRTRQMPIVSVVRVTNKSTSPKSALAAHAYLNQCLLRNVPRHSPKEDLGGVGGVWSCGGGAGRQLARPGA